jgi:hypothetical protein
VIFLHAKPAEVAVAEVLVVFTDAIIRGERVFAARACGAEMPDGMWQGWIEFIPVDDGPVLRSTRETTQPNRQDTLYWATGLTAVYLEGALERALKPAVRVARVSTSVPAYDSPAPDVVALAPEAALPPVESILDPFSVYRKGEALLRSQLAALSPWHLVNIIRAERLSSVDPAALSALPQAALIEVIVDGVRASTDVSRAR